MRLDPHLKEQVTSGPAARSGQPLPTEPHPRAIRQPLRNRHADRLGLAVPIEPHVGLAPFDRQLERHLDAGGDVFAGHLGGPLAAPPAPSAASTGATSTSTAEHVGKATGAAEQALQVDLTTAGKSARSRKRSAATTAAGPASALATRADSLERTAVAVVHLPLARVVEHIEGGLHLLELLLRRVVVGMEVGMVLPRKLPVGLANVLCRCRPRHAERLIVVFRHRVGSGEMRAGRHVRGRTSSP